MKALVLDGSVAAAAFFPETHSVPARALLGGGRELLAPDLIFAEVASVIWKRHRRNEIDETEATDLLDDFLSLPLSITESDLLLPAALKLAIRTDRTVYDCLYLALAVMNKTVMVTADKRFLNALTGTPLEKHLAWIGTFS